MDIQEYISSGILEAYVAGELNEREMKEVDKMAEAHPAIKIELDEIFESVQQYGASTGQLPGKEILDGAMKEIREEEKEEFLRIVDEEEAVRRVRTPLWAVAASILFFISLGFNVFFFSKLEKSQQEIEGLTQSSSLLADQVDQTNQQLDYANLRIAHFLNEDNIHIRMDGLDISPESFANVFWNKKTNAVFISVDNLPEPPHGHQYQLWAIKQGQAPIDAGIFDHNQLIQELKVIRGNVVSFAVTLEKEGGSPIATVEKTYVKGNLKKT